MAHKKGVGSSKNGRESHSKRLGVKIFGGQFAFSCDNVDEGVTSALLEFNNTVNQCVKSVVFTHANVYAWTVNSATLTADDVTGFSELTTKNFHTESFAM